VDQYEVFEQMHYVCFHYSFEHGRAATIRAARAEVLTAAYATHPERFVRKHPEPPKLPGTVWINKPVPNSMNP
jgi:putative transposase